MQQARATGVGAGVIKYDIITALSVMALRDKTILQTTVLRLIALITARYNWKLDQFSVPQTDMARMWDVSDRTVKREIKRMIEAGLVRCIRPGVRGRVGAYRLNYTQLAEASRETWAAVGPDFDTRMQAMQGNSPSKVVKVNFNKNGLNGRTELPDGTDLWTRVLRELAEVDPTNLHNWYMKLGLDRVEGPLVVLTAPSGFIAQFVQTHLARSLLPILSRQIGKPVKLEITY